MPADNSRLSRNEPSDVAAGHISNSVRSLLDELMEAQLDTIEILGRSGVGGPWKAHVDYLQALYRYGEVIRTRWTL